MMEKKFITKAFLEQYENYLYCEEKSKATIKKYMSDLRKLSDYAAGRELTKELVIGYKEYLRENMSYHTVSINSYLVAANGFFRYMGWDELRIKTIRVQREVFVPEDKELTRQEYAQLVTTAKEEGKERLAMVLQTICATGMRVSELKFLTVEALRKGIMIIYNKGKERTILLPKDLQIKLRKYIRTQGIGQGMIFRTREDEPLDRSYIWREMKKLCARAGVAASKVYPHNLRALFARTYYHLFKDIAKLADILGHSSIETTRIYIKSSGLEHRRQLDRMRLLVEL